MNLETRATARTRAALPSVTLFQALGLTALGTALGYAGVDLGLERVPALVLYLVFGAMGLADPLIIRFAVLPALERQGIGSSGANAAIIGFSSAAAGGFYALFAGIAEGRGWPAIPMGAIALYSWAFIWMYVRELPQ